MIIHGQWYGEGSAARFRATLQCSNDQFCVETENGNSFAGNLEELTVSERLGNVERKITLQDGSIFATSENDQIDQLFHKQKSIHSIIHAFEAHAGLAAISVVATVVFIFVFIKWGVPWVSSTIAHAMPYKVQQVVGEGSLKFFDEYVFDDSNLDAELQSQIRSRFRSELLPLEEAHVELNYRLHFRNWSVDDTEIPNAFALPSGDIIVTDKFIELAAHQNEIDAVLLHEMGHVAHRHGLEMIIEGALISTAVMLASGDSTGFIDLGLGVGSMLVSSNYSRRHEVDADDYAFRKMLVAKIDPTVLSDVLQRMSGYMEEARSDDESGKAEKDDSDLMDYLSSHPNTDLRAKQARLYSECFREGQIYCDLKLKF